jgi:hypothetical protein
MATMDERAGEYGRADQWRSLAREIRGTSGSIESASQSADDRLSELPSRADSPH